MNQNPTRHSFRIGKFLFLFLSAFFFSVEPFAQTTIFTTQTPTTITNNDHKPSVGHEVGLKFTTSQSGYITGVRFYKTAGNTGTHIGELYAFNGFRYTQATFTNETTTGWQTVYFSTPVPVVPNNFYTAAYFSSLGNYTEDNDYFKGRSIINGALTAPADETNGFAGVDPGNGQGVYRYTSTPQYPNMLYKSANYWVDPIFVPVVAVISPGSQTISLPTSTVTLDGNNSVGPISSYEWTLISWPGGPTPTITSPNSATTTITGLMEGTYLFQLEVDHFVRAQTTIVVSSPPPTVADAGPDQIITLPESQTQLNGQLSTGVITNSEWSVISGPNTPTISTLGTVPLVPFISNLKQGTYVFQLSLNGGASVDQTTITVLPQTINIFTEQVPIVGTENDHQPPGGHEVGIKFKSNTEGNISGIRFYKTPGNSGTHIGELYSSNGTRLAQATFTNETAAGWQMVYFSSPVTIKSNTTYTAAYFSSLGNYTEENNYFKTDAVINNPLTAQADGTNGANGTDPGSGQGTYKYCSTPSFPNQLYKSANYWVDVIFSSSPSTLIANAGPDQTYPYQIQTLTLNSGNSIGPISSYLWTLVSGPNVPTFSTPTDRFTSVTNLTTGDYVFKLSLNGGLSTDLVAVKIFIGPPQVSIETTPPIINLPTSSVNLLATSLGLADGITTSLLWSQISGPNTANIVSPNGQFINLGLLSTDITGLIQGAYVFQLLAVGPGGRDSARVTVQVLPAGVTSGHIFTTQIPNAVTDNDHQRVVGQEVGVKFTSSKKGFINGIRFYKTEGNIGAHIAELYSANGTRLASVEFPFETEIGWQQVNFPSPIPISANTTYTAAYYSVDGFYTEDNDYFLHHAEINGLLTAPADGTNGASGTDLGNGQGVYKYASSPTFPNQLYRSANYWVDVDFTADYTVSNGKPVEFNSKAIDNSGLLATTYDYWLGQNHPNPVSLAAITKIDYSVPISGKVEIKLFDVQGRQINVLVNETKEAGKYTYELNTGTLAKGVYLYSMRTRDFSAVKKLVVQ